MSAQTHEQRVLEAAQTSEISLRAIAEASAERIRVQNATEENENW